MLIPESGLGVKGVKTVVLADLLDQLEQAGTAETVRFAVEAIAATQLVEAVPTLIKVLGYNNPGAAVAAVDGLIAIGEPAVRPLIDLLDGYNYGARAWALRALAGIGDPRGKDLLCKAALDDFALSVRRAAVRGVGKLRWAEFAPEEQGAAQAQALTVLFQSVVQDPEWVVRYAAVTGLESLALQLHVSLQGERSPILACLTQVAQADPELGVQARARWAMAQLSEVPQR